MKPTQRDRQIAKPDSLSVLALQPFYGGSHRAIQDGWIQHSRHRWTLLTLPAAHWKWRMRHSAIEFARRLSREDPPNAYDILVCTDLMNLAEFKALAPQPATRLPAAVYFHENQFEYPSQNDDPRDLHFGFSNLVSALAADEVWFNSAFNRDSFLAHVETNCDRWPDYSPRFAVNQIRDKSRVLYPGIACASSARVPRQSALPHIVWAARWEHDKNPQHLLDAMLLLKQQGIQFRLSVLGQSFRNVPDAFGELRSQLGGMIEHWGYSSDRETYLQILRSCDVFVSTAVHEFFGLAVAEAIACGAYPLLPNRLCYPELLGLATDGEPIAPYLYAGTASSLAEKLSSLIRNVDFDEWRNASNLSESLLRKIGWSFQGAAMDQALERLVV